MPSSDEILFKVTIDQYVKMYIGTADQHHNLMAYRCLDILADILADIHNKLDYVAFAHVVKDVYPNGIPKSFYKSLAWEGLDGTLAFQIMKKIKVDPSIKSPFQKYDEAKRLSQMGLKTFN
jgi:hypothetical protein